MKIYFLSDILSEQKTVWKKCQKVRLVTGFRNFFVQFSEKGNILIEVCASHVFFLCLVHYWKNAIDLKVFAPNDDDYPCKSFFDDQLQFLLFVLLIRQNCKKRLDVVFVEVRCSSIKLARG